MVLPGGLSDESLMTNTPFTDITNVTKVNAVSLLVLFHSTPTDMPAVAREKSIEFSWERVAGSRNAAPAGITR